MRDTSPQLQQHEHSHASKIYPRRRWVRSDIDPELPHRWLEDERQKRREEDAEAVSNGRLNLRIRRIYSNLFRVLPDGRWEAETVDTCSDPDTGEKVMLHWWSTGDQENYVEVTPHCNHQVSG